MFFENFKNICTKLGTTPTAVVKELGYSSSKVTAWKNGSVPKSDILFQIAELLNVSVATLFGEPEPTPLIEPAIFSGAKLVFHTRDEFDDLTQEEIDNLAQIASTFKKQRNQ